MNEYIQYLEKIWESNQLTNNGPLVKELEIKLIDYFGVKHLFFVTNGTIALQIAIKALDLHGEIITTPFSYVATTSSIVWEGCSPVFVDIDSDTLCINPDLIEAAITPETSAILTTHVYGIPSDVEKIYEIAQRNNLKVIYDASHAFGVRFKDKSLVSYGDISTVSFHATKLFHTVEGGAIITQDDEIANRISYMRNFGHKGQEDFWGLGINGKNSEFHAAMGLCNLNHISSIIERRKQVSKWYDDLLRESDLFKPLLPKFSEYNYSYYPVIFKNGNRLLTVKQKLNEKDIYPRRYFFPSLNELPYVKSKPIHFSTDIANRVLCLPLYGELEYEIIKEIVTIIRS
jgi:dTDP-4-amino-4,6-dideoxygalactose transaminase